MTPILSPLFWSPLLALLAVLPGATTAGVQTPTGAAPQEEPAADASPSEEEFEHWLEDLDNPGPQHAVLEVLIGSWEGTATTWAASETAPEEFSFRLERQWVLGGRFVREDFSIPAEVDPFQGLGFVGFNNADAQYELIWLDTSSTATYLATGHYDPDTRILTTRGSERDPATGYVHSRRTELHLAEPNRHRLVGYSTEEDGREYKSLEVVFRRRR